MALLTIPTTPEKGVNQSYTLNVTDLIALVADAYFQDQANWSKVVVLYQSAESNQLELINFIPDGVSTSILSDAQFSTFARNVFDINSITIFDDQNGRYIIKSSSIPNVANYSLDFTPGPITASVAWENPSPDVYNIEPDGGLTNGVNRGGDRYKNILAPSQVLSGDFEITFTYSASNIGDSTAIGIYEQSSGLFDGVVCGAVAGGGWGPHVNNNWVGTGYPLGSSFSITRVGTTVNFLIDGVSVYSYTSSKTYVPLATLTNSPGIAINTAVLGQSSPLDVVLTSFIGPDTYVVTGNSVQKTAGSPSYGSNIISTQVISSGYFEIGNTSSSPADSFWYCGLAKSPRGSTLADWSYAVNRADFSYSVYEAGVQLFVLSEAPVAGDIIRIAIESGVVKYYKNNVLFYTSSNVPSGSYYLQASLYNVGVSVNNLKVLI